MVCTHRSKAEHAVSGSCLWSTHANPRGVHHRNYVYNQKYIAEGDSKYHLVQSSISHAPPSRSILPEGVEFLGLHHHFHHRFSGFLSGGEETVSSEQPSQSNDGSLIQLTRSCCPWSSGHPTEHSIANAYIHAITNAKHFVYIENQVGSFRYPFRHPTTLRMLMGYS